MVLIHNGFVLPLLQKLRSESWRNQVTPHYREEINKSLARWDRFLDDLEEFQRMLNREGDFKFNVYFGQAGRME